MYFKKIYLTFLCKLRQKLYEIITFSYNFRNYLQIKILIEISKNFAIKTPIIF
jgi:hypothetical protein